MNNTSRFDIDLEYGRIGELFVADLFGRYAEVKTERSKWKQTGNLYIEYESRGKPSGLITTEADMWIHLLDDGGTIVGGFIIPVPYLKRRIKELVEAGKCIVKPGGDDFTSQGWLLPIKYVWED